MNREFPPFMLFLLICLITAELNLALSTSPEVGISFDNIEIPEPVPPPAAVRDSFDLSPFYQQWIDVEGLPVVASGKVNPYAVKEAAWIIRQMIGHRPVVLRAMGHNNVRFVVMAIDEMTTDIPEHSDLRPDFYWDSRTRGLGATPERPAVSCGEENLLNYPGDPYWNENILIHEFSHALHQMGLNIVDTEFDNLLKSTFEAAMKRKLWQGTYASTNKQEYWAEGVQSWFNTNRENDSEHNHVDTRSELKNYDPMLATLLAGVFGDMDWRYTPATTRKDLPHLQGFNPRGSPTFEWPAELEGQFRQLLDPDCDGSSKWVNLNWYQPSHRFRPISSNVAVGTEIIFVNNSPEDVSFYWVDSDGKETYFGRVAAKRYNIQYTYAGHFWLVKDRIGRNLAMFQAKEKTGRALIDVHLQIQNVTKASGDNQQGLVNAQLDNPFVVEVRDWSDKPLPDVEVMFSVSSGGGTLSATNVTSDSKGRAESKLTLGPKPGKNTVIASVEGIQEQRAFSAVGIRIPKTLKIVSGDDQEGLPGTALDKPFVVEVRDPSGSPLPGVEVTFSVSSGGGTLSATSVTTDAKGRAQSTLTLGPTPGTVAVEVSASGTDQTVKFFAGQVVAVHIPDLNLRAQIAAALGKPQSAVIGKRSMAALTGLEARNTNITDLTGLEHATNLETLALYGEYIEAENRWVNNNSVSDVSPLAGLTRLTSLNLHDNSISDISPLVENAGLGSGDSVVVGANPLSYPSIYTHIPALQERGVEVIFHSRTPQRIRIVSGNDQGGLPGTALDKPFVVEVLDERSAAFEGVPVIFTVTAGDGKLSTTNAATDGNGRAESILTLGPSPGTNTVSVSVTEIEEQQAFTAEAIRLPLAFWIITGDKQQGLVGSALANPFVVEVRGRSGEPFLDAQVTFTVTSGGGTLSVTSVTTDGNGRAESTLTLGPNPGTNTVAVSVKGILEKQTVTAIAKLPPIPEDVNGDDVVNILDLVSVASFLGEAGQDLMADVNGDGIVNILDLVLVAGALGNAAAAPSMNAQALKTLSASEAGRWLAQAGELDLTDPASREGVFYLEQLLAALTPNATALLPNYPNPFNPETWIPYQLAEDTDVTLTIYDTGGIIVRRLDIGHRLAGYYADRGRAAYWNGYNDFGEKVASGVYFYHLSAGNYSAARKMLISK